jgi:hypothetical protein
LIHTLRPAAMRSSGSRSHRRQPATARETTLSWIRPTPRWSINCRLGRHQRPGRNPDLPAGQCFDRPRRACDQSRPCDRGAAFAAGQHGVHGTPSSGAATRGAQSEHTTGDRSPWPAATAAAATPAGALHSNQAHQGQMPISKFASDSSLEGGGFELTVPLATDLCGAANPDRSFSSIWTLMSLPRESGAP